jgi:hypothetical protein
MYAIGMYFPAVLGILPAHESAPVLGYLDGGLCAATDAHGRCPYAFVF